MTADELEKDFGRVEGPSAFFFMEVMAVDRICRACDIPPRGIEMYTGADATAAEASAA